MKTVPTTLFYLPSHFWQRSPEHCSGHWQSKDTMSLLGKHLPPFWHGLLAHGFPPEIIGKKKASTWVFNRRPGTHPPLPSLLSPFQLNLLSLPEAYWVTLSFDWLYHLTGLPISFCALLKWLQLFPLVKYIWWRNHIAYSLPRSPLVSRCILFHLWGLDNNTRQFHRGSVVERLEDSFGDRL